MKRLIVNGDDFGASRGINRGIVEAHRHGILTSMSLLVNTPWSGEAAKLSRIVPDLSVGLHAGIRKELSGSCAVPGPGLRAALREQFERFQELMGHPPTHLDSHHNTIATLGRCPIFSNWRTNTACHCANTRPCVTSRSFTGNGGAKRTWSKSASRA